MNTKRISKASTALFFNRYKRNEKGLCPVSLCVTFERKRKYYGTVFSFTPEDWAKIHGERPRGELKEYKFRLTSLEKKATKIIETLSPFTWERFERRFLSQENKIFVSYALLEYAKELRANGQIGTAVTYECAARNLAGFKPRLTFADATPDFFKKYEAWILDNGGSVTTVSMYVRSIRAIFNKLMREDAIPEAIYPFGRGKYEIPTGRNIKKALTLSDIGKIMSYQAEPQSSTEMAKDYFIFSYLCNGMNFKDMLNLRYSNIKGDNIVFVRAKTARTKRTVEPIEVPILPEVKAIIYRWGNVEESPDTFIFPHLKPGLSAERERDIIQLVTHLVNEHLKKIAKDLGLPPITTYSARHSFASVLKRSGASTEMIGEALGHSNVKTTQNYLGSFESDQKRAMQEKLLPKNSLPKMKAV